jgi:sensor c-di-GMP phosphodiesterase-like protein
MRFHGSLRDEARDRMDLLHELDRALERGDLEVHYQPVVRLPSQELGGYEALVRWRHPTRGLLPPSAFLDLAEETGAVVPIGWWVLEEACSTIVAHDRSNGERPLQVAVNLSPRQLRDRDVVGTVGAILATTGLDPSRLVLELTESSLLDDDDSVPAMRALQALGVRLAIDDFGTGYSSLAALAELRRPSHRRRRRAGLPAAPPGRAGVPRRAGLPDRSPCRRAAASAERGPRVVGLAVRCGRRGCRTAR